MSDSNQENSSKKEPEKKNTLSDADKKKLSKVRFAAPLIPGGVVAALLIASLVGYEVPVYSANIQELALASTNDTETDSAVTLPELTEQPDESTASTDTIESIASVDESDAEYADGTYTGTGTGWGGTITVQVVIKNGRISSVTILSAPDETPEYFTKAKSITSSIVKAQSTNVDTVSGATYSSNGIIEAVRNALAKASGSSSGSGGSSNSGSSSKKNSSSKTKAKTLATVDESNVQYADGTWTGTGEGWGGDITVKVKIKNGVIKKITVVDASDETAEYFAMAKAVIDYIVDGQTTNVDTVSGATFSSNGIIEAVRDALSKASAAAGNDTDEDENAQTDGNTDDGNDGTGSDGDESTDSPYADGTYSGTAEGWGGDITVAVTIVNGTITAIEITEAEDETPAYLKKAKGVIDYILSAQSTEVDVVSGATYSSEGIINAVQAALDEAAAAKNASDSEEDDSGSTDDPDASDTTGGSGSSDDTSGTEEDTTATETKYLDGTYTGTGEGWGGDITVAVTVSNDEITAIEIIEAEDETPAYLKRAQAVIDYILAAQSTEVDTVSGATYSSEGIIEAVNNALADAEAIADAYYGRTDDETGDDSGSGDTGEDGSDNNSGNEDTSGDGSGEDESGDNSGNEDTSGDDSDTGNSGAEDPEGNSENEDTSGDDSDTGNSGAEDPEGNSENEDNDDSGDGDGTTGGESETDPDDSDINDGDDSGSSGDSDGTTGGESETDPDDSDITDPEDEADSYTMLDGSYAVSAMCYADEWLDFDDYLVTMTVTITNDRITAIDDVTADTYDDNLWYLDRAAYGTSKKTGVVTQIVNSGTTTNIDVISGATCSSNAIIDAANAAIEEATAAKSAN